MCYIDGSIDQATSTCPMCKIFRPVGARCPHKTEVCRNKSHHPRHGVVHLKNAEVQSFNGCGYCKWARTNPPPNKSGYFNPGWPGCCRQPTPQDYAYISPADWPAISVVHRISIPPEVKAFLETLPSGKITSNVNRGIQIQNMKEKNNHSTSKAISTATIRNSSGASVSKSRADSVGPQPSISSSPPAHSTLRTDFLDSSEQRIESIRTTPPASLRKLTEVHNSTPVRSRPSSSFVATSSSSLTFQPVNHYNIEQSYQLTVADATSSSTIPSRVTTISKFTIRDSLRRDTSAALEDALMASTVTSDPNSDSSSCSSGGSRQDGTVTSDGGFTDYLSDESEAEMQRQAEARAALLELNRVEEQEFKAARQQLATIDLQPPKGWNINLAPQQSPWV